MQLKFDESTFRFFDKLYQSRDVAKRRRKVMEALGAQPGERILDLGCGPGWYVAEIAEQVGPRGSVFGVDLSSHWLLGAREHCKGLKNVDFHEGDAMSIPEPDGLFDAAIAVQVLEYVPDTMAALAELFRVLRPGGRLVIWDADWSTVSMHSADQDRMLRVLHAWDDHLAHPELPHVLARQLREAGFSDVTVDGTAFVTTSMDHETYGGSMVPLIGNYVAGHHGISKEEAHDWLAEQQELDEAGAFFFACLQVCFTAVHGG